MSKLLFLAVDFIVHQQAAIRRSKAASSGCASIRYFFPKVGILQRALKYLHGLRGDLEKVRMLADFARKREREKSRSANIISNFVDTTMFPFDGQLQVALEQISAFVYLPVPLSKLICLLQDGS